MNPKIRSCSLSITVINEIIILFLQFRENCCFKKITSPCNEISITRISI